MRLTFLGATGTVTGSRYLVESKNKKILIDCGLFQGYKELRLRNWSEFPIPPSEIEAIILTHAHLDHSGYIPLLVKNGFKGKVFCTPPTLDLCKLLLPDSGYLQEEDAIRANKYHYSKHDPALPLYTLTDAEEALTYFRPQPFGKNIEISEHIKFRFERNGHILGAAWISLLVEKREILFSGDIGRPNDPVMKAPIKPLCADYLIVESTYGDKCHEKTDPLYPLETIIKRAVARGGTVVIPSFAVGRAQSIMYYLHKLKVSKRIPDIPIYLDSPMAISAEKILGNFINEHRLSRKLCRDISSSIIYVHTPQESRKLDESSYPKIIVAASGMATGGRVLHHIKCLAPEVKNTILFTGFQAGGTRGDRILRGEKEVKIHGQMVPINAEVSHLSNMSAHADYEEILSWLGHIRKAPINTFITHGEKTAAEAMQSHIQQRLGWNCIIPDLFKTVDL